MEGTQFNLIFKAQFLCTKSKRFYGRVSKSHPISLYQDKSRQNELIISPSDFTKRLNEIQFLFFTRAEDPDTLLIINIEILQKNTKTGQEITIPYGQMVL